MAENLIVAFADDDQDTLMLASDTIPSFFPGYSVQVHTGKSKEELVKLVRKYSPQLIITDHNMPIGDNGADALREIREAGITTRAILMSGVIEQAQRAARGIKDVYFLAKIYTTDQLKDAVRNVWPEYFPGQ